MKKLIVAFCNFANALKKRIDAEEAQLKIEFKIHF